MKAERKSTQTVRREGPVAARPRTGSDPKLPAHASCPACGATHSEGRWTWSKAPKGAPEHECPACRRIRQRDAGGVVTLAGAFALAHRDEVIRIVKAREALQKANHPLERIIAIEPSGEELIVTTTEPHLANAIVHALGEAFKGECTLGRDERPLRAAWRR